MTALRKPEPALSDSDRAGEYALQMRFFSALKEFIAACELVRETSSIQAEAMTDLLAAVADSAPTELTWDEKISDAKYGY